MKSAKSVYFDNSSTSIPKAPGVAEAINTYLSTSPYNKGRGGYKGGYDIAMQVLEARELLAKFFNAADPREVIFTPSTTYALNMVIDGYLKPGDHVITTSMEHNSVMRPLHALTEFGIEYDVVQCDETGVFDPEDIRELIREETFAVIMTHASNVCGTVLPIKKVGALCQEEGLRFIVDAAQTAGVLNIDVQRDQIDALCFPGHKALLGPTGIGGMVIKTDFAEAVEPTIWGGTGSLSDDFEQPDFLPDKFEPGTPNVPGILGLKAAIEHLNKTGIESIYKHEMKLYRHFVKGASKIEGIRLWAADDANIQKVPALSVDFPNHDNAEITTALDKEYGIMVRCGLHCSPAAHKTLRTFPKGTVRFSFGHANTIEEVDYTLASIKALLEKEDSEASDES